MRRASAVALLGVPLCVPPLASAPLEPRPLVAIRCYGSDPPRKHIRREDKGTGGGAKLLLAPGRGIPHKFRCRSEETRLQLIRLLFALAVTLISVQPARSDAREDCQLAPHPN